jgi:GT2 family glycosyltransferase
MSPNLLHKLRFLIFSPESKFELWARSLFHRLSATRLYFWIQDKLAIRSLRKYLAKQQDLGDGFNVPHQPKVTFLIEAARSEASLQKTLHSLQEMAGENWEALLFSSDSLYSYTKLTDIISDSRVKTYQPDQDMDQISGDFLIICQAGDQFFPSLLARFYQHLNDNPSAEVYYYDVLLEASKAHKPKAFFKPGSPSPALLLSVNLYSRGLIRVDSIQKAGFSIKTTTSLVPQEYDLILHLCENNANFSHIPAVLLQQATLPGSDQPEIAQRILEHLSRSGLKSPAVESTAIGTRYTWQTGSPSTAIIILTKNHPQLLKSLIASIFANTSDRHYTITVVDNDSDDPAALAYYDSLNKEPEIKVVPYHQAFNYSQAINLGVSESSSDLVLLMNDDMQVKSPMWLHELTQWAALPEVGVVGAKLIRANHTIQHAGIIMGLTGFVGHIYLNAPEHYFGLWGSADWYRNVLAVTGACQMMRREVFNQVGGYDEGYQLAFGDIVFCLRVHEAGYQNIYTPFAQIFHYEGKSRGHVTPLSDIQKGYRELEPYLLREDPFFSPNLTYSRIPKCALSDHSDEARAEQIRQRKKFYFSS